MYVMTTSSHTWLRVVIAIFCNHIMNVDMPAQSVEGVVAGYQMKTEMNQSFTVRPCSVLYEPRLYPPQQRGGLAAFETEDRIHYISTQRKLLKMHPLLDAHLNVANIFPFSR
jgi:hypothetical protein